MAQQTLITDVFNVGAHAVEQRTLLLVDDENNVLSALERLFVRSGYRVLKANGGPAGLEMLEQHDIGVIISDQRMPGMTGVEFLSQVRQHHPDVVRLMLSGFADLKAVTSAINEGAIYRFLTKPCDNELLCRNVAEAFLHFEMKRMNQCLRRELQASNQELKDALKAAEQKSQAKAEFIATMSHELRTPLNGVLGMTELLQTTRLLPQQREYTEAITNSGTQLLTLINDILDDAKAEAGKLELESIDFDLLGMVEDTTKLLVPLASNKGLELISKFDLHTSPIVRGDPTRLRQVLTNLIGNAIKFTPEGEVVLRVSQREDSGDVISLRFEISDTGIGIDAVAQACIFERFSQANSATTRVYGGSGLGLSICRQLVQAMDGEIGLVSELGQGSRFWFTIQLARVTLQPVSSANMARGSRRVLVADDSLVDQTVVCGLLRTQGLETDVVANGKQALEALSRQDYGLVLMDCRMPLMDGYETTRQVREQETPGCRLPVIAMTANAMRGDRERCLRAGMDDYIVKPINPRVLQTVISHWLPEKDNEESVSAIIGGSS
ncbi:MAG: hypothetical protein BMS9Abin09_0100 [Gammaproteobacteria bacterium]|nr:MAG: hypothetical protein BMS9Abin09_0100 [Gammaproteobacteria bacterium]